MDTSSCCCLCRKHSNHFNVFIVSVFYANMLDDEYFFHNAPLELFTLKFALNLSYAIHIETFARKDVRMKKVKICLVFVENLANSQLQGKLSLFKRVHSEMNPGVIPCDFCLNQSSFITFSFFDLPLRAPSSSFRAPLVQRSHIEITGSG